MKTKDIYFSAFLLGKGYKLIGYEEINGIITFEFEVENEKIAKLDYMNSKFKEVKMKIKSLKELVK